MSDIFHEVEEDVRRERYEQLWKKYGNYLIVLAGIVVLGVGAYQVWRTYDLDQRQKVSDRYQAAEQTAASGNAAKAETEFAALVKDAPAGYATLAKLHLAGAYIAQGKRDPAIALLRELSASSNAVIADTARLRLGWTLSDASPKAEVQTVLQPLLAATSPWRFAAGEVVAYMDLKSGPRAQAIAEYTKLAEDQQAPAALRQRAGGIAQYLTANPEGGASALPAAPAAASAPAAVPAAPAKTAPSQGSKPK